MVLSSRYVAHTGGGTATVYLTLVEMLRAFMIIGGRTRRTVRAADKAGACRAWCSTADRDPPRLTSWRPSTHQPTNKGMKYAADRVTQRLPFSSCLTQSGGAPWVWGRQHTSPVYQTLERNKFFSGYYMNIKQTLMKLSKGELVGKLLFAYGTLQRMEEKLTASNTGSPKLPLGFKECESLARAECKKRGARFSESTFQMVYGLLQRQLRASA